MWLACRGDGPPAPPTLATKVMFAEMNASALVDAFDRLAHREQFATTAGPARVVYAACVAANPPIDVFEPKVAPMPAQENPILVLLESLYRGKFPVATGAMTADIYTRGFAPVYNRALIFGRDDKIAQANVTAYRENIARRAFIVEQLQQRDVEAARMGAISIIIEKKLGPERLAELERGVRPGQRITALLTPAELAPIQSEYERMEKYVASMLDNKCEHLRAYRKFRVADDLATRKRMFAEMKPFFGRDAAGMITCDKCKYPLMCAHVRDFAELDFAGKSFGEIKAKMSKYIDRGGRDQMYCKICGEIIAAEITEELNPVDPNISMNEELRDYIWGEVSIIAKRLKFDAIINTPQLVTSIRDAIYPFIFEIEKQIRKSKTNSADEEKAKRRVYIAIYAYAYAAHVVDTNRHITFLNYKGKETVAAYLHHAIEVMLGTHNTSIRLTDLNADMIKNKMIDAYKSMRGDTSVITATDPEPLIMRLVLDPIAKYIFEVNIADELLTGHKRAAHNAFVDRVDEFIGNPHTLEKREDIYSNIRVPKFDKWRMDVFDKIPELSVANINAAKKILHDTSLGCQARSFQLLAYILHERLYTEPVFVDVSVSKAGDVTDVAFREPFVKYNAMALPVLAAEERRDMFLKIVAMQSYSNPPRADTRRFSNPIVSLGRIYDEEGRTHSWSIFVAKGADSADIEYTARDVAKSVESGKRFDAIPIDKKCAVCGVLKSGCDALSEAKIRTALDVKYEVGNFFRFYENRCPKGGLHDNSPCVKCGYVTGVADTPAAIDYYREFKPVYTRERAEFSVVILPAEPVVMPADTTLDAEYATWAPNFNVILDLANKTQTNSKLISALAATEKQEYSDVATGTYIPAEPDSHYDARAYAIAAYIKNLTIEWNQIRNFHRWNKPSASLSELIDVSGIHRGRITELAAILPDVADAGARSLFTHFQLNKKPRELVAFALQTFCEMLLRIYDDKNAETDKLRKGFVVYFLKKSLRSDELLAKPGQFNWALLYGDGDTETKDVNFDKETDAVPDDDTADDPLSMDAFDVEADPDADPDDTGNNVKAGDEYGL